MKIRRTANIVSRAQIDKLHFSTINTDLYCDMPAPAQLAKHLREVYFGGNWTYVNLKQTIEGLNWKHALTKVDGLNTIAALFYHIQYFVHVVLPVLQGGKLEGKDSESFDHPEIKSQEDWDKLVQTAFGEAEHLASLIERLPEEKLDEIFTNEKYGNYFRNLLGIVEHTHYHLGQISILRKLIETENFQSAH